MSNIPHTFGGMQFLERLPHISEDLFLTTCGIQNCSPGHFYGPGSRDEYLLHFVCDGKGTYVVNQTAYTLGKGDFFLILPGTKIHYYADNQNPWSYLWIGFQGKNAPKCIEEAYLGKKNLTGRFDDLSLILSYVQEMLLAKENSFTNELKRQSALLRILAALIDKQQTLPSESNSSYQPPSYVQTACNYIQNHYDEDIRISQIADFIGIDRSYLTNLFKDAMEISPLEYLIRYRLNMAVVYLETTDLKINSIAAKVGYHDALTFSKRFRQHYHMSPSEYRKSKTVK